MKPQSPCMKCEKRAVGCHDTCKKYQEYKKKLNQWNEKVRKSKGGSSLMVKDISKTECDKYLELIQSLEVGKLYRYIGDGEFEIVDIKEEILKALLNNTYGGEK